jgi:peptidyl-prolyl cis-trans isomerase C
MKKQLWITLAIAALLSSAATVAVAQNIAIVNGKAIPKSRMDAFSQQITSSGRAITPEMMPKLKEALITREIFAQEAAKRGLDGTDSYKTKADLMRQGILIDELISDFKQKNAPSDAEIKAKYDQFTASAGDAKEYRARHILVATEKEAQSTIAKIKKGAKFEDLAKKISTDKGSGANGGDLEWANPANYVKEFADALKSLSKGKMTETPVKTQFGYHIIRLDDVRQGQLPKFDEVKGQIAEQLMQEKMAKFQEDLVKQAKVE